MTIKDFLYEIMLTFSAKKSLFSSKKIERFLSFMASIIMLVSYYIMRVLCFKCTDKISIEEVAVLTGLMLGYGAWNTVQGRKDKEPKDNQQP